MKRRSVHFFTCCRVPERTMTSACSYLDCEDRDVCRGEEILFKNRFLRYEGNDENDYLKKINREETKWRQSQSGQSSGSNVFIVGVGTVGMLGTPRFTTSFASIEIYITLLEIFISFVQYLGINEKIIRIPRFIVVRPTHVYESFCR